VLDAHGVDLIGIGMESSIEDFVGGEYFAGEIYFDRGMVCYNELGLTWLGLHRLLDRRTLAAYSLAGRKGIEGNWRNPFSGQQLGATYVISQEGKILFKHHQDHFADHTENSKILEALGISLSELPPPSPTPDQAGGGGIAPM